MLNLNDYTYILVSVSAYDLGFSVFLYIFAKKNMEKTSYSEERPDYLRATFENFFRYAKLNHCKIPFELLVDSISAGLSGANYPEVNRAELLQSLIDNCQPIREAAIRTLELRQPGTLSIKEAEEPAPAKDIHQKIFLKLDEVCERFSLPKSRIKDRKWREDHHFPCQQTAAGGTVTYRADAIEKWIANNQIH